MWIQNHTQSEPKNYIETTHEESWYPCNQCDYKTTHNAKLKNHLETTKEESWYPCNQCEYKTTHRANLKNHVETTPKESWYPCNQCEYKIQNHTQSKNEESFRDFALLLLYDHIALVVNSSMMVYCKDVTGQLDL